MFSINFKDPRPIYEQLAENIENLAIKGVLQANSQLPSVRQLAMELSINPNTIQKAYTALENRGVTYSIKGKGSFISENYENFSKKRTDEIKENIFKLIKEALELGVSKEDIKNWIERGLIL